MDITSIQNPKVKQIVKLREDKRQRQGDGLMLVEGFDELNLAIGSGLQPQSLLTAPELATRHLDHTNTGILTVSRKVFEKMSYRENPDGWLGVFQIPGSSLADVKLSELPLLIVAESVEKPGNLGAILRTADAAHVDAVIVSDPRVDLWNPNVIRASRGTIFTVATVEASNPDTLAWLKLNKIQVLAATPSADIKYTAVDCSKPTAIIVGTEDEGLTDFWMSEADVKVRIPMLGRINSLNVSTAAAIIIYEALRQRNEPEIYRG